MVKRVSKSLLLLVLVPALIGYAVFWYTQRLMNFEIGLKDQTIKSLSSRIERLKRDQKEEFNTNPESKRVSQSDTNPDQQGKEAPSSQKAGCPTGQNIACVKARSSAEVTVFLMHYGNERTSQELQDFGNYWTDFFSKATSGKIKLKIIGYGVKALPRSGTTPHGSNKVHNYSDTRKKLSWAKDESLDRLWYYYYATVQQTIAEIYAAAKNDFAGMVEKADVVAVLTETQFEGNGYWLGKTLMVENPLEIAWGHNPYRTEKTPNNVMADSLTHEIGHFGGLNHSNTAIPNDLDYYEWYSACNSSPSRQDIMGNCKDRAGFREGIFTDCTLNYLVTKFIPVLKKGGKPAWQGAGCP